MINVPIVFTDYCEEACHLAACCIESVTGRSLRLPVSFLSLSIVLKIVFILRDSKVVCNIFTYLFIIDLVYIKNFHLSYHFPDISKSIESLFYVGSIKSIQAANSGGR